MSPSAWKVIVPIPGHAFLDLPRHALRGAAGPELLWVRLLPLVFYALLCLLAEPSLVVAEASSDPTIGPNKLDLRRLQPHPALVVAAALTQCGRLLVIDLSGDRVTGLDHLDDRRRGAG